MRVRDGNAPHRHERGSVSGICVSPDRKRGGLLVTAHNAHVLRCAVGYRRYVNVLQSSH